MRITLILLLLLFCNNLAWPQSNETVKDFNCGLELHQKLNPPDAHSLQMRQKQEEKYRSAMLQLQDQRLNGTRRSAGAVWTIPVVVHIVHTGDPLGSLANPTDATVQAIISEASMRFRHMHPDAKTYSNPLYGVDTEIELCLATQDPDGNATTGINRYVDGDLAFLDLTTENVDPYRDNYRWDFMNYLNLVIVKDMTPFGGLYVHGRFMTFYDSGELSPGLIVHEIGHEFGLEHTFGLAGGDCTNNDCLADGDFVCDTPPKGASGGGFQCMGNSCTTDDDDTSINNPYRPVANGGLGDQNDMLENYLDYSDDCWDAFTQGQKDRMRFMISTGIRSSLVTSQGCQPACVSDLLVDHPIVSGVQLLQVGNSITGIESISGMGTDATFSAGNFIILDSGFQVMDNAQFLAEIGGCP